MIYYAIVIFGMLWKDNSVPVQVVNCNHVLQLTVDSLRIFNYMHSLWTHVYVFRKEKKTHAYVKCRIRKCENCKAFLTKQIDI